MVNSNALNGVSVAGVASVSWTLRVPAAAAAHPADMAHVAAWAAAAITPPRKRRTATAIAPSVDRGTI